MGSARNIFVIAIYAPHASILKAATAGVEMGQNSPQRRCGSANERKRGLFLDLLRRGMSAVSECILPG